MKVLWICNNAISEASKLFATKQTPYGGWLVGLSSALSQSENVHLSIAFPYQIKDVKKIKGNSITYYGFPRINRYFAISNEPNKHIKAIIDDVKPDLLHIHGTEYPHTLAAVKCFNRKRTIISIQGLLSIIAKHYCASLPSKILKLVWISDIIFKRGSIRNQAKRFYKDGLLEKEAINRVDNIIGRTTWDRACTLQINPQAKYFFCNETLRDEFYKHTWDIEKCERHSIFVSQGSYPIKGLHFMLEAMPEILRQYPDAHLYVAGSNVTAKFTLKDKLKRSSYGKYISELIWKFNLQEHITFTGELSEKQMCERYLKSHIFVSPSIVENESNSLSEAKIMGVPSVASYVGGVIDRIEHGKDGFFYQHDAPYMLAYYVDKIFKNKDLAISFSKKAKINAQKTNDIKINIQTLKKIYEKIQKSLE